jgi:hypothetical protein
VDLQALQDRLEIYELLARYARGVDDNDWDLYRSVFTDDAVIDYSAAGLAAGPRDEVAAELEKRFAAIPWAQHIVTNIEVTLDGDRAAVLAMFWNPMQLPGLADPSECGGYYHHDLVRSPDGWKIARLVEDTRWFHNPPPTG